MKKTITQEITPSISHAIFIEGLMRVCADDIKASLKYAAQIDKFGMVMLPFHGELSLCASLRSDSIKFIATAHGDHTPVMLKLIQAGFEIGESRELHYASSVRTSWNAPVEGQGIEFTLYFYTDVDASEAF